MRPDAPVFVPGTASSTIAINPRSDGLAAFLTPLAWQTQGGYEPPATVRSEYVAKCLGMLTDAGVDASMYVCHAEPEPEPSGKEDDWQQDTAEMQAACVLPLDDGGDEPPSPSAGLREPRNILADFKVLHVVGRGGFGKVMQVERRDSGEIFAIKTMRKTHVVKMNDVIGVKTERSVLTRIRHPFIVKLRWAFHTPEKLYLVMEFVNGGTLFFWMRKMGLFTEPQATFFAAELLLALEHLHAHNIVHRDLKPENILLRPSGHLVLTDFGCAKEYREALSEKEQVAHAQDGKPTVDGGDSVRIGALSRSMVGTEAYMAPEVISREEHGVPIDLWSYGVLLFEVRLSSDAQPLQIASAN
jgi:serine/threonine protein kinase